ncbi:MAG: death-on-curing protein [Bacteroidia bacterium]|nr:MAG: death-on-curing protein [Bacteroidia bacterium]
MAIRFIPKEVALIIHSDLLQRYGGRPGLRDPGLLDSALGQPMITVGGKYANKTLFDKAAAYGFHICKSHPFVDGNKRVAFVLMDVFLQENGWDLSAPEEEAYTVMMALASGQFTKPQLSTWLKRHSSKSSRR